MTVLLNIINEYNLYVGCDMDNVDKYAVKIELSCCPQCPATLLNEKIGIPMLVKEFIERVKQCKETGKSLSVDSETGETPKAWMSVHDGEGNIKNAKCEIRNLENSVLIHLV